MSRKKKKFKEITPLVIDKTPRELLELKNHRLQNKKKPEPMAWMEIGFKNSGWIIITSPKGGVVQFSFKDSQKLSRCIANMFRVLRHFEKKQKGGGAATCQMTLTQINELTKFIK